jgi:hypothetical protein
VSKEKSEIVIEIRNNYKERSEVGQLENDVLVFGIVSRIVQKTII